MPTMGQALSNIGRDIAGAATKKRDRGYALQQQTEQRKYNEQQALNELTLALAQQGFTPDLQPAEQGEQAYGGMDFFQLVHDLGAWKRQQEHEASVRGIHEQVVQYGERLLPGGAEQVFGETYGAPITEIGPQEQAGVMQRLAELLAARPELQRKEAARVANLRASAKGDGSRKTPENTFAKQVRASFAQVLKTGKEREP